MFRASPGKEQMKATKEADVTPHMARLIGMIILCIGLCSAISGCRDAETAPQPLQPTAAQTGREQYGGVYRYVLAHEPLTLDPAFIRGIYALSVVQQVFDGLVQFDADLNVIPSLAQSWEASRDGRVWTFHIRSDATFHNGRTVTAADVIYSFTRLVHPNTGSPYSRLFKYLEGAALFRSGNSDHISGLHAVDTRTVQITLSQRYVPFIRLLGSVFAKVVPREEVERLGADFGRHPVGTGPFQFVDWKVKSAITLQANETYFEGRPFLDQIQYSFLLNSTREQSLSAFERGDLEDAPIPLSITKSQRQHLIGNSRYRFFRKPILATRLLLLHSGAGALVHSNVRRAINLAINRDRINRELRHNRDVAANGILPPGILGYQPNWPVDSAPLAQARHHLQAAGYPQGKGLPPIELWSSPVTASSTPTAVAEHQAIKRDLSRIGIVVVLRYAKSWEDFRINILGQRPGAMYHYSWYADFPDPDNFLFTLFHSQGANNRTSYHNPQVDELLERAQREPDSLKRLQLNREAEQQVIADGAMIGLGHYTFDRLFQPYVQGIALNALGRPYIPMKKVWFATTTGPKLAPSK